MELKEPLFKILNKVYESNSMIEKPFRKYDAAFKMDEEERLVLLFLEKKTAEGKIKENDFPGESR